MNGEFNFHRKIEFDILRKTEKALLIRVNRIESDSAMNLLEYYSLDDMELIELWTPKSWFKLDYRGDPWVWEEGFLKNLRKLALKREKYLIDQEEKKIKELNETK
jgi:hypothetical protein